MQHSTLRLATTANSVMVVASAGIVTGIASYFMLEYWERNFHLVYHEAIVRPRLPSHYICNSITNVSIQAIITLVLYGMGMIFPFIDTYKGWRAPFHVIFAALWLAAFVFAVQDFTGGRCTSHGIGNSDCGLKKAELAFDFIAL